MALGGITAGYNENTPSGTSQAGLGQTDIRSAKTTFQQALDSEHIAPNTGGAGWGAHRKGSAVAFHGASSTLSSTDTNGRLMVTSDTSRLHHAGSSDTMVLGGRFVVESDRTVIQHYPSGGGGTGYLSKLTQIPTMEAGVGTILSGSASTTITLHQSYVAAIAFVTPTSTGTLGGIPVPPGGILTGNSLAVGNVQFTSAGTGIAAASNQSYQFNYLVLGIKALG